MSELKNKISAALDKYGEKVYNMTLGQLRQEFGETAFPVWISKFTEELSDINPLNQYLPKLTRKDWIPLEEIPVNHEEIELWEITESFCYLYSDLAYSNSLNQAEKEYFMAFSDALRYKISLVRFIDQ